LNGKIMKTAIKKPHTQNINNTPFFNKKGASGFFDVQAKLNVGKPKDKFEKEADHVADKIVEHHHPESTSVSPINKVDSVQRDTDELIGEKPISKTISPLIQKHEEEETAQTKSEKEDTISKQEEKEEMKPKLEGKEDIQKQEEEEEAQAKAEEEEDLQNQEELEEAQAKSEKDEDVQKQEETEEVQSKAEDDETLQKQEEEEEEVQAKGRNEKDDIQKQNENEEEEEIQARSAGGLLSFPDIETVLHRSRGKGSPLSSHLRSLFEKSLGVDLGSVRVHTDSTAVQMSKELRAQAFTNRSDIYFNEGKFDPTTKGGFHLLGHELAHTIQQGAVPLKPLKDNTEELEPAKSPVVDTTSDTAEPTQVDGQHQKVVDIPVSQAEETEQQDVNTNELQTVNDESAADAPKDKDKEGAAADELKKEEVKYPTSPQDDPAFMAAKQKAKKEARKQQSHRPSAEVSKSAQDAAPSPENERQSMAQAGQVDAMDKQEPGEFNAEAFKAQLMARINSMQLPKNNEEADNFEDNNNIEEVSAAAKQDVASEKDKASGGIEQATTEEPDPQSVPEREIVPMPPPDVVAAPGPVGAAKAMPKSRPVSQVNQPLNENMNELTQEMADNEVTDEQLAKANEPTFTTALNSKKEAKAHTETAPTQFRDQENQTLNTSQQNAEAASQTQLSGMQAEREGAMTQVTVDQTQTASIDTAERARIAMEINTIYEKARSDVEAILSSLDETVSEKFSDAAARAKEKFEAHVKRQMKAYKSDRYSGILGKGRWIKDKFKGLPNEVNVFFTEGREIYIDEMDAELTLIAAYIAQKLTEAKDRIALGKQEVTDYVQALPENLKTIGKEAAEGIQDKFDALEENVNSKQDELIDSLAQQYNQSLQEVDARIEEMKAANRGLIDKALDAVVGVIKTIIKIKETLMSILSSAVSVIKSIISDPIGFLGNLISGISMGFKNFGTNILKHLTSGLIGWLTGALGPMGITIPENIFSLKGIFSLVMQVLGLTWEYIRKKAVKLLGETVVAAMEKGFEIFQIIRKDGIAGLWNYIKDQFNDLKETIMDAIKSMVITKVIEAGIKWVLGLMSPAGAFIKAAMMIIDVVRFFIERGRQIIELVRAFIDGVSAIASGSVGKVAEAIENALSKALPVVIGFLASLLGISGLASKVQKLIKKIRKRIDKAIDKVILKAKKWFKKAGSKLKNTAVKFFQFWKAKKTFKGADGKSHKLYFKGSGKNAELMVASTPATLTSFISNAEVGSDADKKSAKIKALAHSKEIDKLKATTLKGNEAAKSKKSKEIKDAIDAKMGLLAPLLKTLMVDGENSVEIVKQYLNKKVTNKDGSVNKNFIKAFDSAKNKLDSQKVYLFNTETSKITRAANRAKQGFLKISIDEKDGFLRQGAEKEYVPPHTLFEPENMVLKFSGGKYVASYETEKRGGGGKQKFTVDINYDQIDASSKDQTETRNVEGENMAKKPGGIGRGKTDSAGGGFDNAHLIGDQFGGSGYNQGLNIYPSSEKYNRKTMLDKEQNLADKLQPVVPFKMRVSAKISHKIDSKNFNGNNVKNLLESEFAADNSGQEKELEVKEGMTKKMRADIAKDLDKKKIPGQFMSVKYSVNQEGKSFPASIGKDSAYDDAVNKRLASA